MTQKLNAHFLPDFVGPHDLAGNLASQCTVVIDVLRASTTIITALAAGATRIVPCLAVAEARSLANKWAGALLGGERHGLRIDGFDLANSPAEYTAERVTDKTVVFTTTNGTKAMARCTDSGRVLIGALINRAAVCDLAASAPQIDLLCAGTDGLVSLDDVLTAGAMAEYLLRNAAIKWELNDTAQICHAAWKTYVPEPTPLAIAAALGHSLGGRNLIQIGQQDDLLLASQLDQQRMVPVLDRSAWELRPQ